MFSFCYRVYQWLTPPNLLSNPIVLHSWWPQPAVSRGFIQYWNVFIDGLISRYRTTEGICNNLDNPHWGAAMNAHHRFLPPDYADGVSAPRISVSGFPLPNPRKVSTTIHKDDGFHDHAVTIMMVAWGQFMDHDITLTAETRVKKWSIKLSTGCPILGEF